MNSSNPINRLTILTHSGLTAYHQSFDDDGEFDEFLFSGFTSAILSFIKEMGNELSSIKMKGLELFFRSNEDCIIVLGVDSENFPSEKVDHYINEIGSSPYLEDILDKMEKGVQTRNVRFEDQIEKILRINTTRSQSNTKGNEKLDTIYKEITEFAKGSGKAKKLAIKLIGKEIDDTEAKSKRFATEMIQDLLESADIEKKMRKRLNDLLVHMLDRSTRAGTKAKKALF